MAYIDVAALSEAAKAKGNRATDAVNLYDFLHNGHHLYARKSQARTRLLSMTLAIVIAFDCVGHDQSPS